MEILSRGKGLWEYDNPSSERSDSTDTETNARRSDMALAHILLSIYASCKAEVMTMREPKEIWKKLKKTYHAVSRLKFTHV